MTRSALVAAAGDYLTRGLAVIALNGKTPNGLVHKHGLNQALRGAPESETDWDLLTSVFDHPNTTGVGILTGEPYVVVDIDGEEGADQWRELVGDDGLYEEARWVAKTGRGLHLWYSPPLDLLVPRDDGFVGPGTIKLGPKLDLKGYGGYVAAPPSLHPDGHRYLWLLPPGDEPPFECPAGLAKEVRDRVFDLKQALRAKELRRKAWGPRWTEGSTVFYAQPGHDSLIEGMTKAAEGNRNAYLHWAAATLGEEGAGDEWFDALFDAAVAIGLTREETKRTIRSARKAHG